MSLAANRASVLQDTIMKGVGGGDMRRPRAEFPLPWIARLARCRRGAAAVEFGLLVPVLLVIMLGIVNYGLVMFNKMELVSAARSGVQLALADYTDTSAIKDAVVNATNLGLVTNDVTTTQFCECGGTTITCGDTSCTNEIYMTITASKDFTLLLVSTTLNLSGSATIRVY